MTKSERVIRAIRAQLTECERLRTAENRQTAEQVTRAREAIAAAERAEAKRDAVVSAAKAVLKAFPSPSGGPVVDQVALGKVLFGSYKDTQIEALGALSDLVEE